MPDLDEQRLLDATMRRSRQLRNRRRILSGAVAAVAAAAIAVPVAALSGNSSRQGVVISPGPSTPTTAPKLPVPPPPVAPNAPNRIVTVPDVVGATYSPTANVTIADANLVSDFQLEYSSTVTAGTVIAQSPAAGSQAAAGSTVLVGVSIGPASIPGAQPCRGANLKATPGNPGSEASGMQTSDWSFTNLADPCVLTGFPAVTALDKQGRVLGFSYSNSGDGMTTGGPPQPVYLPRGSSAWIRLNKYRCDIQAQDASTSLRLGLPFGGGTLDLPVAYSYCAETASSTIVVSPFEAVEMLLFPSHNTNIGPLAVQLTARPDPVSPGDKLTYTITVINLGPAPLTGVSVRFPLPEGLDWWTWSSSCQGAGPTFMCTFGGDSTSPAPGPQARLRPGQSQAASITTVVSASSASSTTGSFTATVTASGSGPSGPVGATATETTTEI